LLHGRGYPNADKKYSFLSKTARDRVKFLINDLPTKLDELDEKGNSKLGLARQLCKSWANSVIL
jgi:hypothetical protein